MMRSMATMAFDEVSAPEIENVILLQYLCLDELVTPQGDSP